MSIWVLVGILCISGTDQCYQADIREFADEASCLAAVDDAVGGLYREYVVLWVERTGQRPPPARVGAGCREDKST